ncbi:MAG: hypothetical protein F4029_08430, partial [Gammaproteobacteria bacterium]|nr:hypothetical protein [Gammaproteobacteria bacterium]
MLRRRFFAMAAVAALGLEVHADGLPTVTVTGSADPGGDFGVFVVEVDPPQELTVDVYFSGSDARWRTSANGIYRHQVNASETEAREYFVRIEPGDGYEIGDPHHATIFLEQLCAEGHHRHGSLSC